MNERIKKLRKALNLTQQEFASKIGSTQNVLANYESGRRNPSSSVINNICKTFNISEQWLRTGDGEMFLQNGNSVVDRLCAELHADELEIEIIRAYFRVDEKIRLPFLRRLIQEVQSGGTAAKQEQPYQPEKAVGSRPVAGLQMSREELHAELDRQIDAEKETAENA